MKKTYLGIFLGFLMLFIVLSDIIQSNITSFLNEYNIYNDSFDDNYKQRWIDDKNYFSFVSNNKSGLFGLGTYFSSYKGIYLPKNQEIIVSFVMGCDIQIYDGVGWSVCIDGEYYIDTFLNEITVYIKHIYDTNMPFCVGDRIKFHRV